VRQPYEAHDYRASDDPRRGVVSYARRGERMTAGQRRAWERLWPRFGLTLDELDAGGLDVAGWFGREAPLLLEIGTGMGETTAELAAAAPAVNYLAVEVYRPGLAQLLMRLDALGLRNVRLVRGDAMRLLRTHLGPGSLAGIRVYFPDPWPKARHHKRRLVEPGFVALAASRLAVGGALHLATDWEGYAEQMLAACTAEPRLRNEAGGPDGWSARPPWRPVTKFEQRAVAEGRTVRDLLFRRVADQDDRPPTAVVTAVVTAAPPGEERSPASGKIAAVTTAARFTAPVVLPCDPLCSVVRDGVVDVDGDGRIGYVGGAASAPPCPAGLSATRLDGILLPGLINAHAHSPMTVLRGAGGDLPLMAWLRRVIWPAEGRLRAADVRAGMLLGCVEMLRAGVTTSVEMYFYSEHIADAVLEAGSRAIITPGIIAVPGWERLGTWQQMLGAVDAWIDADGLRFGPGSRIELGYGPHSAYTLPPRALADVAAAARERGALLHTHVAESTAEDSALRAEHGSVPMLLAKVGALGGRVLAAHAVHLSDADVDLFARHDVAVAHCPGSNAKLASGIAPTVGLRAAGVPVGLGTDGPASNDDLDLWEEIRLAALLARLATGNAAALTAREVLLMATRGGAAALGRDDLGTLQPGSWADMVHLTTDSPAFVAGADTPDAQLLANLVWAAGSGCVRDVWVAGERVLADGEPTRVDRRRVQAGAAAAAARLTG
jgi:5-methylthioadenosine/S-adenosylhomocysteine deaminase